MSRRGNEVRGEENCFSAAGQANAHHIRVVARRPNHFHSRDDFRVSFQQPPLPGFLHRQEVFGKVAGAVAVRGRFGVLEFVALHDVARIREDGQRFPVHDARVPAAMIEVQMRVDHNVDLFGRNAVRHKLLK